MLQHLKKPTALVCALILCLSMLSGIVLPYVAETALAVADPYAQAHDQHATQLVVADDGTVTLAGGVPVTVPDQYKGQDIFLPDGKLWFYNPNWRSAGNAGVTSEGDYIVVQYGDGVTWGNGKVYVLQWGITAFGGMYDTDIFSMTVMQDKIAAITPTVGGDNNYYIFCFPGTYNAGTSKVAHTLPSDDPAASDVNNVHFLGAQAGKSPVGPDAEAGIANGRGLDDSKETVLANWVYSPRNAVYYWDGFALTNWCRFEASDWIAATGAKVSGLYLDNLYVDQTQPERLFAIGWYETWGFNATDPTASNGGHNYIMSVVHMNDSYFKISGGGGTYLNASNRHEQLLEANDLVIDGCVFDNFGSSAATKTDNGEFGLSAGEKTRSTLKFLGDRAGWNVDITNNTFINNQATKMISIFGTDLLSYGDTANININGNRVLDYGNTLAANTILDFEYMDRNGDASGSVSEIHQANVSFCDNYITVSKKTAATNYNFYVINTNSMDAGSKGFTIRGNTIVNTKLATSGNKWHYDFASSNATQDLSGNLFLDYENRVRAPRVSTVTNNLTEYTVLSDIYASDEMAGGLKELFTVTESPEDLFVAHSMIQTVVEGNDTTDLGYVRGTLTVYPENGVTYDTKNLFSFGNEEVKLVGVYTSEADAVAGRNKVSKLNKGFSTAGTTPYYVKAEYQAGTTTATVIYTMVEPTKFHVAVPSGATTYTFNGTTYTAGDTATFYTTLAAAVAGADVDWNNHANLGSGIYNPPCTPTPLKSVVIVAPGTYADAMTMTRATAIIGPGFGKKASTQGAVTVANGRGTSATTEAVITGITTLSMHGNIGDLYVAMSGVSFNGQDFAFAYDYSGTVQANNQTKQRFAYLNLCDIYAAPGTALVRHGGFRSNGSQYWDDSSYVNSTLFYVNVDNSYMTQGSYAYGDPLFYGSFTGLNITDSTLNAANNPYVTVFKRALSGTHFVTKPLRDYLTVDNCYVKSNGGRVFENVAEGHATSAPQGIKDTYGKGSITSLTNNIIETTGIAYRIRPHGANTQHLVFTGNTVQRASNSATDVLGNYINTGAGAVASDAKLVTADISGNKIINSTKPWNITAHNSVDVNENYYGTSDGKAQAITAGEGSGYTIDQSWYYVNEACTVKSTDIALTQGGFNSIELVNPLCDYTANVTANVGETYTKSDFTSAKGEILSISTDPAGEKYVDSFTFDGTNKTVYVRVKYKNYIATWTVNITSNDTWVKYGFGLLDSDPGYVDLTSDAAYDARANARTEYPWLFVAPDWTAYAYTTYENGVLSGAINATDTPDLIEATADEGDVREMVVGTTFYAKMPTTGVVYKLTYGVTAANSAHARTASLATIVLFPGSYSNFSYNASMAGSGYIATYKPGMFGLGNRWKSAIDGCNDYLILGPYAGITSANTKTGENTRYGTWHNTEAILSTNTYMYFMEEIVENGNSTVTIDGLAMWYGFRISFHEGGNAAYYTSYKNTVDLNVLNCRVTNMSPNTQFFGVYGYQGTVGTDATKNTMAANVRLNLKNSYFGSQDATNAYLGLTNANEVNIDGCVIDGTKGSLKGIMINPTSATKNDIAHTLKYSCNNSYVALPNSYLFNIEYAGTSGLPGSVVTGITVEAKNNTFVNCAQGADSTNGSIINLNSTSAALNALTTVTFTGNKVINNTGADPAFGSVLTSTSTGAYKSVTVSKNEFTGYRTLFTNMGATTNFADNIYYDHNGKFISAGNKSGVANDIVLSDTYDRHISDFEVTAGLLTNTELTWTPGYNDVTGTAVHNFTTGITVAAVLDKITFASDKVEAVALYTEDGTLLSDSDTVAADTNYRLTAAYKDDPELITVLYYVTTEKDTSAIEGYTGTEIFWDPRVEDLADGTKVVRSVGGTEYYFTVGKNILATLDEFPLTEKAIDFKFDASHYLATEANATYLDRYVYLLPTGANDGLEYSGSYDYGSALGQRHIRTYFYGPFAGKSAVTLENGVPTDTQARTDRDAEAIMKNFTFALGNQAGVIFDGVTLAGVNRVTDNSGGAWVPGTAQVSMLNCNTFAEEPLQFNSGDSMFNVTSNFNREGKILNNYLILDEEQANNQYLFNGAVLAKFEMGYNYISSNEHAQLVWLRTTSSAANSTMAPYHNEMDVDIYNNRLNGVINIGKLSVGNLDGAYQDATFDQNFITDIKINGNVWDQKSYAAINFEGYTGDDTLGYVQFANTSIAIEDNTFNSDGTPYAHLNKTAIRMQGNRAEGEAQFKKFSILGNTFNNNADNPYSYAFNNMSDTVLNASGNTFVDFTYNYGTSAYMTGSVAFDYGAYYATYTGGEYTGPGEQNVTLTGATFKVGADELVSNADGVTIATVASSGPDLAVEDGTIYDIAAAANRGEQTKGAAYLFSPVQGMMVKATTADGKVYYNAVPLGTADELTFTAELCTLDGTVVDGSEMTVSSYREPIKVVAEADKCKVTATDNTAGTFYWQAKFAANHDSYIVDLINNSGFKITDYGIYHAEDEALITDTALQKELDASVTKTSYIGGAVDAGLDDVKLHYSMTYQDDTTITESTTRYGKFYMTYKVGNRTYTVFSDTVSLTRHVAAN